ncbi:MAG: MFS transporter [Kiritimatiellae bacterium]|nr:MFS transporter [Kiritimatiellia bacterium]
MSDSNARDRRYKWVMLALLAFTYFLMHATRQVFNASLPDIKASLPGTSDTQWGLTRTAFLFAYGLAVPLAGIAADMMRRKWVVIVGAFLFSASVLGTGFVDGFVGMLVMYGLMNGIGQCMIPASASSLIAQYHHETRSTALSIYQTGLYFGIIVASALAGWLGGISTEGWRYAFWAFGAIGVVWTFALVFSLRDSPPLLQSHRAGEFERASFKEAALAMVSKPSAVLLTVAFGMLVFGSNCFRTFLPLFMRQGPELGGFALSPASAALHSVVWFYIGSFIGIGAGARLSDRFVGRFPAIRINMLWIGLAISAPAMAAMVYMPNLWLCCLMTFVFGVGGGLFDCSLYSGLFEVVAPRYRAAAMGVYLCGAFLIGCPATAVLGYVGEHFSYQHGIAIFGGTYALGAVAVLVARYVFFARDRVADVRTPG